MRIRNSKSVRSNHALGLGLIALFAAPLAATQANAQSESVIYSFPYNSDPQSRPLQDNTGAFFVTAPNTRKAGTAIKITENHGRWKGRKIFNFTNYDGKPIAGVVADPNDVLYGVTQHGGVYGQGTVFSLQAVGGTWGETVLHDFTAGADGGQPVVNLVRDKATGTLYGATPSGGGGSGCGTTFSLVQSGGNWTFNTLYSFAGGNDGCEPDAPVHAGVQKGTYFGTTSNGGTRSSGTVYELVEQNGSWTESVVYSFTGGSDGNIPQDLDIDPNTGDMYGVTFGGGEYGHGAVFELTKSGHIWKQSVLYNFTGSSDGGTPVGLHFEKTTGTLFGTTEIGGNYGYGTLFELTKRGASWSENVLHSFGEFRNDGLYPQSRPVEDPDTGTIYGTTPNGGLYGGGTVYAVVP